VDQSLIQLLASHYRRLHDRILVLIDDLGEQYLSWQPLPTGRSIAQNVADLTRSSQELQRSLAGVYSTPDGVSAPPQQSPPAGEHAVNAGHVPQKEELLEEVRRTFAAVEQLFPSPHPGTQAGPPLDALPIEASDSLLDHFAWVHQRLGEIESLTALQGQHGAAPSSQTVLKHEDGGSRWMR
jgi:hypothetical protein